MAESRAQYACDACRSRKVGCSRDSTGCQRCKTEGITCSYSRLGVIRRNRKRKDINDIERQSARHRETLAGTEPSVLQRPPQLASDNVSSSTTHERLQRLVGKGHNSHQSLTVLASLLEECAAAWHDSSVFDKLAEGAEKDFFLFEEDQVRAWVDAFVATLQKERILLTSAPPEVLEHLAVSRPHQVHDRAWLVMFYTVALNVVSSVNPSNESTKARLKSNLWLAFNDVRLLLEPNLTSIQALVFLACHTEEFMTPSLCWALVSKACIMLQALGITHWRLDLPTRERRTMLFWRLNVFDKALALILCRPPTLHREMATGIAMPTLDQLLPSQPYHSSTVTPALFNAHYTHQMHLLSRVTADVWHCLYGQDSGDIRAVKQDLESWHRQATEVLGAAALAEKPILIASGAASVELGLRTLRFHYYSLLVLLTVSSSQLRMQCIYPAQQMLKLLPTLDDTSDFNEPYTCLLWQRLHAPLSAFGALWGEIVIKVDGNSEQNRQCLEAMEHLPAFLGKLRSRNSLASKLESITERFVQYARSSLSPRDEVDQGPLDPAISNHEVSHSIGTEGENLQPRSNQSMVGLSNPPLTNESNNAMGELFEAQQDSLFNWPDDCFFDATFDWFA